VKVITKIIGTFILAILTSRVCKFRNLCYHPKIEEYFIIKDNTSTFHGLASSGASPTLSLVAIQNHSSFNWAYSEISASNPEFQNIKVRFEALPHFLLSRLIVDNVMHTLHDNAIGLFQLFKRVSVVSGDDPFSMDNRLLIVDGHLQTTATLPLTYLSHHPIRTMSYMNQDRDVVTCFKDAYVGNSDETTWYQYGFSSPQGPIPDKQVNGYHIREYSEFVKSRIKIPYSSRGGKSFFV
jgi:protein O-mannose beta-1,4-N-acetylglucosaminyltransferase